MNGDLARGRRLAVELHDLRGAALALSDAIVLLDDFDRVSWCNPAANRLLGLARPRDQDVALTERFEGHPIAAWLRESVNELVDTASPIDTKLHLQLGLLPYGPNRRLLFARDISRVVRLEQIRRDFVANVSHELRTPLTVIHGYLELVDPEEAPAWAPVIAEMRIQSQRMRQIVEDLLALSHLEIQQQLPEGRVEMTPLLNTLWKEAKALSQARHNVSLQNDADVDVLGSVKELHSAFSNLVSNAVRYTPAGGNISIRWRSTAGGAEYSVIDTGYGIPAEHISRLTERFYRVSSSRSRGTGGTGLGLSIVRHVLNLHEATLRIESEPGKGSVFTCVFEKPRLVAHEDTH